MSLSRLTLSSPSLGACSVGGISRRFSHRSPDYNYLEKGVQDSSYFQFFQENLPTMNRYPQFMRDYFRVAAVMKCQNRVPLIHAQNAGYRVPSLFLRTLSLAGKESPFFKYLRQPSSEFYIEREVLDQKIQDYLKEKGRYAVRPIEWGGSLSRLDTDPLFRPYLISVSYSMMDFTPFESSFWFFFNNFSIRNSNAMKSVGFSAIQRALEKRGQSSKFGPLLNSLIPLYDEYEKLKVGTLYVIGIPRDKIERFAYDSKHFGIPTEESIASVSQNLVSSPAAFKSKEGGLQARLMMFKETLTPYSDMAVIDINDSSEVEAYCKNYNLESPDEVFQNKGLFRFSWTEEEQFHRWKQVQLDAKVKQLALEFKNFL